MDQNPLPEDNQTLREFRGLPKLYPFAVKARRTCGKILPASGFFLRIAETIGTRAKQNVKIPPDIWNSCIPKRFVGKCQPRNVERETVFVLVQNPVVGREIMFEAKKILALLNKTDGLEKIKRIRVV